MKIMEASQEELQKALGRIKLTVGQDLAMVAFIIPLTPEGNMQGCFISSSFKLDHRNCMPILQNLMAAIAEPNHMVQGKPQ